MIILFAGAYDEVTTSSVELGNSIYTDIHNAVAKLNI